MKEAERPDAPAPTRSRPPSSTWSTRRRSGRGSSLARGRMDEAEAVAKDFTPRQVGSDSCSRGTSSSARSSSPAAAWKRRRRSSQLADKEAGSPAHGAARRPVPLTSLPTSTGYGARFLLRTGRAGRWPGAPEGSPDPGSAPCPDPTPGCRPSSSWNRSPTPRSRRRIGTSSSSRPGRCRTTTRTTRAPTSSWPWSRSIGETRRKHAPRSQRRRSCGRRPIPTCPSCAGRGDRVAAR